MHDHLCLENTKSGAWNISLLMFSEDSGEAFCSPYDGIQVGWLFGVPFTEDMADVADDFVEDHGQPGQVGHKGHPSTALLSEESLCFLYCALARRSG